MKLESIKKHDLSTQHKDSEAAQRARARPDRALMELALQTMEQDELEQMKRLFNTAFYLVVAERPFREEIRSVESRVGYLPMWQRILNESKTQPSLTNILAQVTITRVIPVQTATLEQGFSLIK